MKEKFHRRRHSFKTLQILLDSRSQIVVNNIQLESVFFCENFMPYSKISHVT